MDLLQQKLNDLKKNLFLESKVILFKSVFTDGYLGIELINEFKNPNLNLILSLLETNKIDVSYRIKPSAIYDLENTDLNIEAIIKVRLNSFFREPSLHLMFSYIYNYDFELNGYITVTKKSLCDNLWSFQKELGFIVNPDNDRFIYYKINKSDRYLYCYEGIVEEQRFIQIQYP